MNFIKGHIRKVKVRPWEQCYSMVNLQKLLCNHTLAMSLSAYHSYLLLHVFQSCYSANGKTWSQYQLAKMCFQVAVYEYS